MRAAVAIFIAVFVAGCSESAREKAAAEAGGTLVIATLDDPQTLFPPFVTNVSAKQITEQIYDYLADVGPSLDTRNENDYRRELAESWRWSTDSLSLSFHLNPRARWHDGQRVTAADVRFTYEVNKSPVVAGRYVSSLDNIDSVTVGDSVTPVFWFHRRSPTQFLDAAAQLLILPSHQLEKIPLARLRQIVLPPPMGSGRFRFRRWNKGASVEIVADTANYRGRAKLDRVIWSVTPDYAAAVAALGKGDIDFFDGLRPEDMSALARRPGVRLRSYPGMAYSFLRFNLRDPSDTARAHPLFGDRDLRRALTMSIDRNAIVRSVFDTFATVPVGPTVRAYPTTDPRLTQIPFDSARASRLFDSLGWIRNSSGVRAKNGKELGFRMIVSSQNLNRIKMSVLLQEQLRRAGARVNVDRMETVGQNAEEERGNFDTSIGAWVMSSSPDGIRDAWGSTGIGKNGVNYGAYSNPRFDALLDSALSSGGSRARDFSAAYQVINDDAPAVWLAEPRKIVGIHRRIRTSQTRPDAWWFSLSDWWIPPTERVLRDRIPGGG